LLSGRHRISQRRGQAGESLLAGEERGQLGGQVRVAGQQLHALRGPAFFGGAQIVGEYCLQILICLVGCD
jgi:hypothetical protein